MRQEWSQEKHARKIAPPGILFIVGVPIGHPDDVSIRALTTLRKVALVASKNPLATRSWLEHHGLHVTLTAYDRNNAAEKVPILIQRLMRGDHIALVSDCGMPLVFDPGKLLIAAAARHHIQICVIPGPSAVTAAVVAAGMDGDAFVFDGRWGRSGSRTRMTRLEALRSEPRTLVFFFSGQDLRQMLPLIHDVLGDRRAVLVLNLTSPEEQVIRGSLSDFIATIPGGDDIRATLVLEGRRRRN
ncbi:16S rRNA (cytidine(1402)-2'-O)-methyltransferase [Nitrospirales bacterium NOB]|nr:16S rRNA (cytidine(1402)-2'-O)-methyltransferase [Nitrospirales bacterium NOB]